MGILALAADERVADVKVTKDSLSVSLRDGRTISVPLAWYPRLQNATPAQRKNWKVAGGGYGIHWPEIDEDLSTEGLLRGAPAPRPSDADRMKRFKVGDTVRFRYGKGTVQGIVREDRGPLGIGGRHLYDIEFHTGLDDEPSHRIELPAVDMERVVDPIAK
jgi:hypothetical protein